MATIVCWAMFTVGLLWLVHAATREIDAKEHTVHSHDHTRHHLYALGAAVALLAAAKITGIAWFATIAVLACPLMMVVMFAMMARAARAAESPTTLAPPVAAPSDEHV